MSVRRERNFIVKKLKKGFTLAEVLITLAIIGVVAAIVMPSVIASYQLKTVGVKLAKFAGTVENSARAFTASNGAFPHATKTNNSLGNSANLINEFLADSLVIKSLYETDITYAKDNYAGLVINESDRDNTHNALVVSAFNDVNPQATQGAIAVLKDNTKVMAYPISDHLAAGNWTTPTGSVNGGNINTSNVGEGAFILAFDPAVNGLPSAKKKIYYFVVTETGFVFPAADDDCAWEISNNDWNSTSTIMDKTPDKYTSTGQSKGTGYSCTKASS